MSIQKKLALIAITSIIATAIPASIIGYIYTKEKILSKEINQITYASQVLSTKTTEYLKNSQPKLKNFATLLQSELIKPISKNELSEFNEKMELNGDGVWRNRIAQFDGYKESSVFLPPNHKLSDAQKIMHMRIKNVMDIYGAAENNPKSNIWFLSPGRSEVIFDRSNPNFAFDSAADNDYTQTPWVTYTLPSINPSHKLRFTPPLYDPVAKAWMVSAVYPLYVNDHWVGSLGEDMQLTNVLSNIFTSNQFYKGTQHFLLDENNNFILAGDWQNKLESAKSSSEFAIKNEPKLEAILKTPVESNFKLLNRNLTVNGKQYIVIGGKFDLTGWRHYKLVPISAILQSTKDIFFAFLAMIFLVSILAGLLISIAVYHTIVKRIRRLADAIKLYELDNKINNDLTITGFDEISTATKEFTLMRNRINQHISETKVANNALKANERNLRRSEQQFRTLVENVPGAAYQCELDLDWTMRYVGDAIKDITGYPASDFINNEVRSFASLILKDQHLVDEKMIASMKAGKPWEIEYEIQCADGKIRWICEKGQALTDEEGNVESLAGFIYDITETKEHQKQLEQIAHFDPLTNLPNRALLADRLAQAILHSQRLNQSLAVAYLDLDGFKEVNDQYGHNVGDQLLIELGQRMKACLRESDTFSRIGGDEFVAVMSSLEHAADCEPLLERLLRAASDPIKIGNLDLNVSVSIGVTRFPQDGSEADQLMRHADQAMYLAKQAGKNGYHLFDIEQDLAVKSQRESLQHIGTAIKNGEFVLYYQPKVNMKTGLVIGAEALIRWQHPERGLLPPSMFLPVIENHPHSLAIGEWVIDAALTQMSVWQTNGLNLPVSVNIGALQLQQENFVTRLSELLAKHPDVDPNKLELEIVETSAIKDIGQISELMQACRLLGVHFALDDFGTGYSSLTYLKRLPANMLKIDQSFVRDMIDDADDLAIVVGVVGLAKAFHREVIAEGVETIAHGELLLKLGCELAQGYGIAKPMAASEIPNWVKTWRPDVAWLEVSKSFLDQLLIT
jgi:diguanylate cyclase (GGDEF)-like protein/PAS domain S-box-containing protein